MSNTSLINLTQCQKASPDPLIYDPNEVPKESSFQNCNIATLTPYFFLEIGTENAYN